MTKQCKALELCDELISQLAMQSQESKARAIKYAIQDLITEHEAALAKAAGEWVLCSDRLPFDKRHHLVQFKDGKKQWGALYPDHDGKNEWGSMYGIFEDFPKKKVIRWFDAAVIPEPPPIEQPEPEIEVPDLDPGMHFGVDSDTFSCCNEAHKAAMRPVLTENQALKARIAELESRVSE